MNKTAYQSPAVALAYGKAAAKASIYEAIASQSLTRVEDRFKDTLTSLVSPPLSIMDLAINLDSNAYLSVNVHDTKTTSLSFNAIQELRAAGEVLLRHSKVDDSAPISFDECIIVPPKRTQTIRANLKLVGRAKPRIFYSENSGY